MTSRERVLAAINHQKADKVPVDLGGTVVSGLSATAYANLRRALGLEVKPCELVELLQYVALVEDDVREKLGIDTKPIPYPVDSLGFFGPKTQVFTAPNGTQALVHPDMKWDTLKDGSIVAYAQGDTSHAPSLHMLQDGMYFDNMVERIPDFDEDNLTPLEDFKDDFKEIPDEVLEYLLKQTTHEYENTDYALVGTFPMALLGDLGTVPGCFLKEPRGIRKLPDVLAAHVLYPEYLEAVYTMQTDMTMHNLERYYEAVGDRIQVVVVSTADYGNQNGCMISPDIFRSMYKPHYARINKWIHENTHWKTFYHSCGGIADLLEDYIDMGADIINPLQLSARGMDGKTLHEKYQDRLVFWGGGVNTQGTMAFGTPEDVRKEVLERLELFNERGGYVFNAIHNLVGTTSTENMMAMFDAVREYNGR